MRIIFTLLILATLCSAQDKKFWALTAFNAAATSADAWTTVNTKRGCVERWNPELYGLHPQPARVGLVMGGLFAVSVFASYELKKKHRLWIMPQAVNSAHLWGAIHNLRMRPCG